MPLTYNDHSPIEPEKFRLVKERLLGEFGGLTYFPQRNEGFWQVGNVTFHDQVVIFRVLTGDVSRARAVLKALKAELKETLRQEEVLIVERDVRIV